MMSLAIEFCAKVSVLEIDLNPVSCTHTSEIDLRPCHKMVHILSPFASKL